MVARRCVRGDPLEKPRAHKWRIPKGSIIEAAFALDLVGNRRIACRQSAGR